MPDEHEVPELDDTADRDELKNTRAAPMTWPGPISGALHGEAEPWHGGRERVEDALAPATGIVIAVLIAALLWTLILSIIERMASVTATG